MKNFSLLKVIGKGSFGKVLLAKHKRTEQVYAIKVMDKDLIIEQDAVERIMSEHNVLLGNEAHPFLVGQPITNHNIAPFFFSFFLAPIIDLRCVLHPFALGCKPHIVT